MKTSVLALLPVVALAAALLGADASSDVTCSSLNGPFCHGVSRDLARPGRHAMLNLDRDREETKRLDFAKRIKVENVLKQYQLDAVQAESEELTQEEVMERLETLLDETAALLSELITPEEESPVVGSFAFSNQGDTFEQLEKMDGKELKEFFELAYDEVIRSWEYTLEDMSPEISQGLRRSIDNMKAVKDHATYNFQLLDDVTKSSITRRFRDHRLVEVQRAFERLITARHDAERQVAFEMAIFVFQLADADAAASSRAKKTQEIASSDDAENAREASKQPDAAA
ncbi:hypothetical protein ATCC90586_009308 [Pythium insidiosum]|nr:hypothetical protein ATCC90586_009308 [Pythium insidiosum]